MPPQVDLIRRFAEEAFAGRSLVAQMIMGGLVNASFSSGILGVFAGVLPHSTSRVRNPYGIPRQTKTLPFWSKLPSICSVCSNLLLRLPRSMLGEPCVAQVRAKPLASLLCWPCCSLAYLGITAFRSSGGFWHLLALSYSVPPSQDVTLFKQYVPDMTESHVCRTCSRSDEFVAQVG